MQLTQALASRRVTNQARGLLMAQLGCSADQAFVRLIQLADEQGFTLFQAAQALVDRPI